MAKRYGQDSLWQEYFKDPSQWWDNRSCKIVPTHPDFRHKVTRKPLWIDNLRTPSWVTQELIRRDQDREVNPKDECTAFVASLRACTKRKDLLRGTRVHDDILRRGLVDQCSNALVTMYAKCGALGKAKDLFDTYKSRDVFTWTALIAGYTQKGHCHNALKYFELMQNEGLSPDAVTYSSALRACGSLRAAGKGEKIHDEIAKQGLLEKNVVLGNALVSMYAKCGALAKARGVLEKLSTRNIISWTGLMSGYVEHGDGEQALNCFEQMQQEGLSPNEASFVCALQACGSVRSLEKGDAIHNKIIKQRLLENNNLVLGTALVDMYAKCGALARSREVLEQLPVRDVVSWNALITGFMEHGEGSEVLNTFEWMQGEGVYPDAVTFACVLKACGDTKATDKGEKVHDQIANQGLLQNDVVLCTALVDMYAKCGALDKARQVLEEFSVSNVVSWNVLIAGYVEYGQGEQALDCLEKMQREGLSPDTVTFICLLKACGSIGATDKGQRVHDKITKQGLMGNNILLRTALVDMYAKCGALKKARLVLEEFPIRDIVSWNVLISGYAEHGDGAEALDCYAQMQREGLSPNAATFVSVLKACGRMGAADKGEKFHDQIAKHGLLRSDNVLGTALLDMYVKCGMLVKARQVLEEVQIRNAITWNTLITGYAEHGDAEQALSCFEQMRGEGFFPDEVTFIGILKACSSLGAADKGAIIHGDIDKLGLLRGNLVLGNALVDMYAKCGALAKARQVLEGLPLRDVSTWTALISGYTEHGEGEEAVNCFDRMQGEGLCPDDVSFLCAVKACGIIKSADKGDKLHDEIVRYGLLVDNIPLRTALVDMYAKCGGLAKAARLLQELPVRDAISWNALLAGYAEHGEGAQTLKFYQQMQREGLSPDAVTYLCILKACGTMGAVDKGEKFHEEISKQGLLQSDIVLGTAVVDMYAKCGALAKARQALGKLPVQNVMSWNALIAGYVQQCEVQQALDCFEQMHHRGVSPDAATFSCVLTACSRLGLVEDAQKYFVNMKPKYRVDPDVQHGTCMIDLFGRAGHLDRAVGVIEKLRSFTGVVWSSLMGACRKWVDVDIGRWAFEHAIQLDKMDAAAYLLMLSIYAAAGMHKEAENIEAMRIKNKAWKNQGQSWWIDMSGNVYSFSVGDEKHAKSSHLLAKIEGLMYKIVPGNRSRSLLCAHCHKLALACALINSPGGAAVYIVQGTHICTDCHHATSLISKYEKRAIVVQDVKQRHEFEDGKCSCGRCAS